MAMESEHQTLREEIARIISGAPFPSPRSFAKADALLPLITREAERMRERCAHKAEVMFLVIENFDPTGEQKVACDTGYAIANAIRALPLKEAAE